MRLRRAGLASSQVRAKYAEKLRSRTSRAALRDVGGGGGGGRVPGADDLVSSTEQWDLRAGTGMNSGTFVLHERGRTTRALAQTLV